MKPGEYGVMVSTVLMFYLFSTNRTLSLIKGIRDSRGIMVFVFTITLALLFTPHMYSFAVSLGFLLLAVSFYPSSKMDELKCEYKEFSNYKDVQDYTIKNYYS